MVLYHGESLRTACALVVSAGYLLIAAGGVHATATYRVDPQHASVRFTIAHLVLSSVAGRFNEFEGIIRYDADDVTKSSLVGTIKAASIDTDNESRDEHLRNDDFFDVPNHPEIRFRSRAVERRGNVLVLIGDLTMRGVTRQIEIPAAVRFDADARRIRFSARLELNRQDYGIAYGGFFDQATIGDVVSIELSGEAIRQ